MHCKCETVKPLVTLVYVTCVRSETHPSNFVKLVSKKLKLITFF